MDQLYVVILRTSWWQLEADAAEWTALRSLFLFLCGFWMLLGRNEEIIDMILFNIEKWVVGWDVAVQASHRLAGETQIVQCHCYLIDRIDISWYQIHDDDDAFKIPHGFSSEELLILCNFQINKWIIAVLSFMCRTATERWCGRYDFGFCNLIYIFGYWKVADKIYGKRETLIFIDANWL